MNKRTRYSREVRERAVRMVFEHEREYTSQWSSIVSISQKFGCTAETLRRWVRQAETDRGRRDGTLTEDGTGWVRTIAAAGVVERADLSFVSSHEPWVYCAAHYRNVCELRRWRDYFAAEYGYTAAIGFNDPDAFATWLGINFALGLNKTADVKIGTLDEIGYACSDDHASLWAVSSLVDTIVRVYHGPVHYEDRSRRVDTQARWFDPNARPKA